MTNPFQILIDSESKYVYTTILCMFSDVYSFIMHGSDISFIFIMQVINSCAWKIISTDHLHYEGNMLCYFSYLRNNLNIVSVYWFFMLLISCHYFLNVWFLLIQGIPSVNCNYYIQATGQSLGFIGKGKLPSICL